MTQLDRPARVVMFSVIPEFVEALDRILRERGDRLIGVVTAAGPRSRRGEEYLDVARLARPGLDMIVSNYPNRWAEMMRPLKPDLMFCAGFNWRIPDDVLQVPPLGAFNGHDGLLPKLRGRNATGWALRTGSPDYGITIHRMTPQFDDGPVIAQRAVPILDEDDIDTLLPRFSATSLQTVEEALERILAGYPGLPQDETQVTYSPGAFEPEWREIDWNKPARDVHFQIRSWCGIRGVPRGAFGELDGQRLVITKAKRVEEPVGTNGASPGTVLSRDNGELQIQCADGQIRVVDWHYANESGIAE